MTARTVRRMGDPVLLERAREVAAFDTPELKMLVDDLFDTMAAEHGSGLAAPQIGVSLRVVVFGVDANPRYPEAEPVPTTVLVNPDMEPIGESVEDGWEGCLSVPGLRGLVPRYTHIRYSGYSVTGARIEREARGFHARVFQHEFDHLNGVLYPMRLRDLTAFGFEDVLFPGQHFSD
ncbi:MAG: peptide deformylase [Acidiferrobacteraceae bacterium]